MEPWGMHFTVHATTATVRKDRTQTSTSGRSSQGPAANAKSQKWEFPRIGVPYFGVLIIRILQFRVLYSGPLFSETPKC